MRYSASPIYDQIILRNGYYAVKNYPQKMRKNIFMSNKPEIFYLPHQQLSSGSNRNSTLEYTQMENRILLLVGNVPFEKKILLGPFRKTQLKHKYGHPCTYSFGSHNTFKKKKNLLFFFFQKLFAQFIVQQ